MSAKAKGSTRRWRLAHSYNTRIDRCRRRYGVAPEQWADAAQIHPKVLARYLAGRAQPLLSNLIKLVKGLRALTGEDVRASELYDLGEDEPLGTGYGGKVSHSTVRRLYDTPFDRYLVMKGIQPELLSRLARVRRQALLRKRAGRESMTPGTLARIVRAIRRLGHDLKASYIVDVGER